ncbi:amino acid ABC transporter permease [Neorhizobium tomejilense]|uniref:amino acid ABC transporter permease n=1 Tax=Neorhizobium tomejilense TaxID=2093828 RepID=UPI003ECDD996
MQFSVETFLHYLAQPRFATVAGVTLLVAIAAQAIGTVIGLILALCALSRHRVLRIFSGTWVWLWRGTPPLVQLFLLYFGLPQLGIRLGVLEAGLIGLGCYSGAYMSEIIRGALQSVPPDQMQAARAMGMSWLGAMLHVILPQSVRLILPPFGNEFSSMMRTTSLLSVISFSELLRVTRTAINETYAVVELYAVAAFWYLLMYSAWIIVQSQLERYAAAGNVKRNMTNVTTPVAKG